MELPDGAAPADLLQLAAANFAVPAASIALHQGFPPYAPIAAADLRSGICVDVRAAAACPADDVTVTHRTPAPAPAPPPPPASTASTAAAAAAATAPTAMARHVVPADNSCLYSCIQWLLCPEQSPQQLRALAAAAILSDPDRWGEAVLGQEPAAYAAHMQRSSTWGGAVELAVFAQLLRAELAAVEIRSGKVYIFGEGCGHARRAYLIYDGLHYDALYAPARATSHVFAPSDAAALAGAEAAAAEMRDRSQFTDAANFTLRCGVCGCGIVGQDGAVKHAKDTGHINFQEYK